MADVWEAGSDVEDIAKELLGEFHTEVATANFGYAFKEKASVAEMEAGIVAKAKKVSPLMRVFTDELDFVIEIAKPLWDELSPNERKAQIDSALCSCSAKLDEHGEFKVDVSGNPIYVIKQYDLQGHSEVLARYGVDTFAEVGSRIKSALKKSQEVEDDEPEDDDEA